MTTDRLTDADAALVALGGVIPAQPGTTVWIAGLVDPFAATVPADLIPHASEAGAARALIHLALHSWGMFRTALALQILAKLDQDVEPGDHADDFLADHVEAALADVDDDRIIILLYGLTEMAGEWALERVQIRP